MNQPVASPRFFSRTVDELPADPAEGPGTRQVTGAAFSRVQPTPTSAPRLVAHSREMAEVLGFGEEQMRSEEMARVLSGNALLPGMQPHAACYGGHQFGSWAGQLGDGRAISLGDVRGQDGGIWELQLKGAGPTPYSRRADGRAVLRSSIREFLCSEAMHHLGIPTTRALSLALTGDRVVRDMFYDGHPKEELGAVVCRVAPTFLRFGNFEIFTARGDAATLSRLAAFSIRHFFPELAPPGTLLRPGASDEEIATPDAVAAMFTEVARRTALLVTHWMRVGFVHGVMNTDNMSLVGLSIDYGPYGFLDDFDPTWTPNTTDASGRRYRYGHQPRVAEWNLGQLGSALSLICPDTAALEAGLGAYRSELDRLQVQMMQDKLGLERAERPFIAELFDLLVETPTDMTLFFRHLADVPLDPDVLAIDDAERLRAPLEVAFYDAAGRTPDYLVALDSWLRRYVEQSLAERDRGRAPEERKESMRRTNPRFIFRNYLAQQAIERAEAGDESEIHVLLDLLRRPYDDQPALARYADKRPDWARHKAGCSMLSCSS